ncbi:uncharacterized protein LOC144190159 isoform X1 [Stigmatopora nigra]
MHVLFLRRGRNRSTRRKSTQAWGEHANFNTVRTDLGSNPQPQNCEADLLTKVMVRLLLCAQQCTTPAHVRQRTSSGQLSVTLHVPGSSTCPETPPAPPRSEHDTEADLSNAEANETGNRHVQPRHRLAAAQFQTGNVSRAVLDASAMSNVQADP